MSCWAPQGIAGGGSLRRPKADNLGVTRPASARRSLRPRPALALLALCLAACAGTPEESDPGAVAAAYAAAGRYQEAAREIEVAVRAQPRDLALRRQAAEIQSGAGQPDRAVAHLETAIELAPGDADTWIQLGRLERDRENFPDAYVAYRKAAELAPDDIRAVSGLALTAEVLHFDDEARAAYRRWSELEQEQRGGSD